MIAYVTILGLIHSSSLACNVILLWIPFTVLFTLTPFYLYVISGIRKIATIISTTIAFVIWVVVVGGGPSANLAWIHAT